MLLPSDDLSRSVGNEVLMNSADVVRDAENEEHFRVK